jgi:hypothetical protein
MENLPTWIISLIDAYERGRSRRMHGVVVALVCLEPNSCSAAANPGPELFFYPRGAGRIDGAMPQVQ